MGSRLYCIRHRCGGLVLSAETSGSKPWPSLEIQWSFFFRSERKPPIDLRCLARSGGLRRRRVDVYRVLGHVYIDPRRDTPAQCWIDRMGTARPPLMASSASAPPN